ncbi:uncharacterized protein P174DRAFT_464792 [Aspergillus novofumigatus IBT 16806]|uniref:Uncharacterized protein n=1 Tax=Aspergillus novofumigatus (strain IBT 16806) TaxID=1392255 RepID=A0A2I1BUK5_ASPN1|nr:uncharacterized protein P174DRAFT_464792 [Aspergillus novofumigatus IBT 16806]PKX89080.1 hypothetical protein P174DRAFT_464792 [Aspergillus novofumigatus IBT 16806]
MFCFTSLLECWKASSSASGGAQSPALQSTNGIIAKDHNPSLAGLHAGQLILDVVKAEMDFGISCFRDYCVFTACFQEAPDKLHFISCPKVIHAANLTPAKRDHFGIIKKEWLIISDTQEEKEIF